MHIIDALQYVLRLIFGCSVPVGNINFKYIFNFQTDLDITSILIIPWDFCMIMESFRRWYGANRTLTSTSSRMKSQKQLTSIQELWQIIQDLYTYMKSTLPKIKVECIYGFMKNPLCGSTECWLCLVSFCIAYLVSVCACLAICCGKNKESVLKRQQKTV